MKKGWKWTLISLGVIGAGVGLYFLLKPPKDKWDIDTDDDDGNTSYTPTTYIDNSFPLKKDSGDTGQSVKRVTALQKYLEAQGATLQGGTDGKFGPSTEEAVETYIDTGGKVTETFYNDNIKTTYE
tara:strand:- start:1890 stop:2267 length:378 start_codon:yes stop_codon:yes gene_type:complete